jgi:hypothetical protein
MASPFSRNSARSSHELPANDDWRAAMSLLKMMMKLGSDPRWNFRSWNLEHLDLFPEVL